MKCFQLFGAFCLAIILSSSLQAADPAPCSLSVGIVPRTGFLYRTWANALEKEVLEAQKGFQVCQSDAYADLSDPSETVDLPNPCKTQFKLELLYRPDRITRYVVIRSNDAVVFTQDYPNDPISNRILKTIPHCTSFPIFSSGSPFIFLHNSDVKNRVRYESRQ